MTTKPTPKPAPLGRGLSALFGDADVAYQPRPLVPPAQTQQVPPAQTQQAQTQPAQSALSGRSSTEAKAETRLVAPKPLGEGGTPHPATGPQMMPIEWIQPGAFQPRRHFDEDAIKGLADSIRERGIVQPLMVRAVEGEKDTYELIMGERRWRAAQQVGLHEVPVIVRALSDREALEIGLIENVQRQDLSPIEEAEGYRRLMEEFHHSQDGLAKVVGKSRPHISNMLRLLTLPTTVKQMIDGGQLTMGHARTLITAKSPVSLAEEIVKKGLSVRQAEALAKKESDGRFAKKPRTSMIHVATDANILALEKELERALGLKVKIHAGATQGAGSLTLHYANLEQLDAVIKKLRA